MTSESKSEAPTRSRPLFRQIVKLALALALIVYGVMLLAPRLIEITSSDAIVNAQVVTIRAPIAGTLSDGPRMPGAWIQQGAKLAVIENKQSESPVLADLNREIGIQTSRLQTLETQYNSLDEALKKTLAADNKKVELFVAQVPIQGMVFEARQRLESLRKAVESETLRFEASKRAEVAAPLTGAIYRVFEVPGTQTAQHSPLFQMLDYKSVFADCSIHRDDIQYVSIGQKVQVKPLGSQRLFEGTVASVLGPSSYRENVDYALGGPRMQGNEYRVMVLLNADQLDLKTIQAVMLGTRATVYFGRRTRAFDWLLTLSR